MSPSASDPAPLPAGTAAPWQARDKTVITGVRTILTNPEGVPLVVVRVDTSEPGLYGLGCATYTQRHLAVAAFVENHVARLVTGRDPADIEDLTRMIHYSGYWRNGPVVNNAVSGLDMALWDIAGKRAGMPVHDLLGGRVRAGATTYAHASGATIEETLAKARELMGRGWTHIRLQTSQPGLGAYGARGTGGGYPDAPYPDGWDPRHYLRTTPELFARARAELGEEVELLHDVHSRLTPKEAVLLARSLEPYRLFFLEDVLPPEHFDRLPQVRDASPVPVAVGELCSSYTEAARLVAGGGVDMIRCHISAVGGLSAARKLAVLCETFGAKTAWHAPADVSPVGAAANVAVDVSTTAFGIQESHEYSEAVQEIFPGTLPVVRGVIYPNLAPGWGIDLDEKAAARFPAEDVRWDYAPVRRPDGSLSAP